MLDYARDLALAETLDAVWTLYCATMEDFGFDRAIYGLTRGATSDGALGDLEDALVLSTHPPAYNEAFIASEMFRDAPGFRWAAANTGAIGWGALWDGPAEASGRDRQIVAFQRAAEVTAGVTLSLARTAPRSFAVVSLTARPGLSQAAVDDIWTEDGCLIWTMTTVMHLKVLSLPHRGSGAALSQRQREALEWVGEGKSYQDIAVIMGVSMATVEKHLRLAREKLKVSTTAQAVLKAAVQNRIYLTKTPLPVLHGLGSAPAARACTAPDRALTKT